MEKLWHAGKNDTETMPKTGGDGHKKELELSKNELIHDTHMKASEDVVSLTESSQAGTHSSLI